MSHSITAATVPDEQMRHNMVMVGLGGPQPPTTGLVQFSHVKDALYSS